MAESPTGSARPALAHGAAPRALRPQASPRVSGAGEQAPTGEGCWRHEPQPFPARSPHFVEGPCLRAQPSTLPSAGSPPAPGQARPCCPQAPRTGTAPRRTAPRTRWRMRGALSPHGGSSGLAHNSSMVVAAPSWLSALNGAGVGRAQALAYGMTPAPPGPAAPPPQGLRCRLPVSSGPWHGGELSPH